MSLRELFCSNHIIGNSPALLNALMRIPIAAQCDVTVLVTGETGTGKELVARAIHYQGTRHGKPFIAINCGALPDHLFENEFFGHARGAFTDATSTTKGLIAEAEGGTLFLDEIDALSQAAQIKLLRFLQDREYRPLGSSSALVADVRAIAATNADLSNKVESQAFRQDLYYRLRAFPIVIPPLRERLEDVPLLAEHFLNLFTCQYKMPAKRLTESALQKLLCYDWPGNVRELECTIQQAVLLSGSPVIRQEEIGIPAVEESIVNVQRDCVPRTLVGRRSMNNSQRLDVVKSEVLDKLERDYLVNVLSTHQGNVTHAARAAGKQRRSFQRLLRKHRIEREEFAVAAE
jgi:transcriptional regulator with GAF, ATPase, and Fis domain